MIEALYNKGIRELADAAHGAGRLAAPTGSALRDSPMCGDRVRMDVELVDGRITALAHEVKGCLLCRASASLIGLHAVGSTPAEVERLRARMAAMLTAGEVSGMPEGADEIALFAPVQGYRSRHGCVMIAFEALTIALAAG
ncbi:iron-sulfur cluster assembly scaffold protein [Aromatoleum evansii]|uniref:Iron-sulfur cluster assembly scaffold protein n=2 Tax=Aromatoleum TaxID=551759 RepID=A0ABZ1AIZ8_AROEV|nr:iron-sulfur cluster assembly scaffold protein [Aromatoleum petrolei]NMF90091.1 iron-sulfur cluster assembly scaffold protein [Aromatoleum petrolei]QTQ34210.1 Putative iron-sulfur cluster chaperon, NifU-like [Aromatoleum petrolei]WRL44557.1 iron-sulfur cluster assembly scaffold protein [Aromatoleum evansii]